MLYLAVLDLIATALVAELSRSLRRLGHTELSFSWTCFWLAGCLYMAGSLPWHGPAAAGLAWAGAGCMILAPGAMFLAAWSAAGAAARTSRAVSAAAVLVAAAGFVMLQRDTIDPTDARPLVPALLLCAAGLGRLTAVMASRPDRGRAGRIVGVTTAAYALHLAAVAVSRLAGPAHLDAIAVVAVDVALRFGMAAGLLGLVLRGAATGHERLAALWTASGAGLRLCDVNGRILSVNPAFCRLVGKTKEELEGQPLSACWDPDDGDRLVAEFQQDAASRRLRPYWTTKLQRDGKTVCIELINTQLSSDHGSLVLSVAQDITQRKLAEERLERRERQLAILCRAGQEINAVLDPETVMQRVLTAARDLTGCAGGGFGLLEGGRFSCVAAGASSGAPGCGRTLNTLTPHVVNGSGSAREFPCLGGIRPRNAVSVPLIGTGGKLIACFAVHDAPDGRSFEDRDVLMLGGLASSAAVALENAAALSERQRAEEQLAESEVRHRSIVNNSPIGMCFYTLESGGRLIFRGANPAARSILGADYAALEGRTIEEVFPGLQTAGLSDRFLQVALSGETLHAEVDYDDGRVAGTFDVHTFQTTPGSIASLFQNITERKRAIEAVQASEARYRVITENSTDMIMTQTADRRVTFVSPACRPLFGYEPDELIGSRAEQLIHPEDVEGVLAAKPKFDAGFCDRVAFRMRRKDGQWTWVEVSGRPIRDDRTGEVREIVSVVRDISERRELEEQIRQSQKLESIGRLAGGVAHDFNNLLTVINGYAGMLASGTDPSSPDHDAAAEIASAGARAAALTQQLLAFSRRQILQPRVIDLNRTIMEAERMLRRTIGEDIDFRIVLDPALGSVRADPGQIQQVLLNLTVNARDAMPGGGILLIETGSVDLDDSYAHGHPEVEPGRYALLAVTDSGAGMDPETRSRIFEPFFTTKEPGRGTGLGLSTVFGIVKQSGGHIWVYSEPGHGATFKIYLPRTAEPVSAPKEPRVSPEQLRGSETILVVEDQVEVRRLAENALAAYGYHAVTAGSGEEALAVMAGYSGQIHLVLTDVIMPGMNGRELASRIQGRYPGIRIMFMSGYTDNALAATGTLQPGFTYLQKPFTAESLAGRIRETLGAPRIADRLLVVDEDEAVRRVLRRVLHSAGYDVREAGSPREALDLLETAAVDLIVMELVPADSVTMQSVAELRARHAEVPIVAMSCACDIDFAAAAAGIRACASIRKPTPAEELLRTVERALQRE